MATPPDFSVGQTLTAAHMNAVGLWLIKEQAIGSAVTSVTITDAFPSDYDNFRIVVSGVTSSAQQNLLFQFVSGGVPVGGANYGSSGFYQVSGATLNGIFATNWTTWEVMPMNTSGTNHISFDLFVPNKAERSRANGFGGMNEVVSFFYTGVHQLATAYTDFRIVVTGGTITGGTIRVYGYRS
jgi:hypothetical protein